MVFDYLIMLQSLWLGHALDPRRHRRKMRCNTIGQGWRLSIGILPCRECDIHYLGCHPSNVYWDCRCSFQGCTIQLVVESDWTRGPRISRCFSACAYSILLWIRRRWARRFMGATRCHKVTSPVFWTGLWSYIDRHHAKVLTVGTGRGKRYILGLKECWVGSCRPPPWLGIVIYIYLWTKFESFTGHPVGKQVIHIWEVVKHECRDVMIIISEALVASCFKLLPLCH